MRLEMPLAMPPKPLDPELAAVAAAWPELPPALRAGIVAMVKAGAADARSVEDRPGPARRH